MKTICEGDVFCIPQLGRLKYIGKHPLMGECVGVLNSCGSEIVKVIFYPLRLNVKNGNAKFLERSIPVALPTTIRRPKVIKDQEVKSWFIDDGVSTVETTSLSEESTKLPVGAVVSHQVLLEWRSGGWRFLLGDFDSTTHG